MVNCQYANSTLSQSGSWSLSVAVSCPSPKPWTFSPILRTCCPQAFLQIPSDLGPIPAACLTHRDSQKFKSEMYFCYKVILHFENDYIYFAFNWNFYGMCIHYCNCYVLYSQQLGAGCVWATFQWWQLCCAVGSLQWGLWFLTVRQGKIGKIGLFWEMHFCYKFENKWIGICLDFLCKCGLHRFADI